jgi:hypothetical protein
LAKDVVWEGGVADADGADAYLLPMSEVPGQYFRDGVFQRAFDCRRCRFAFRGGRLHFHPFAPEVQLHEEVFVG